MNNENINKDKENNNFYCEKCDYGNPCLNVKCPDNIFTFCFHRNPDDK